MRNALINLISFYTINIASLSAQVLPVTMHPQQTNKWCWAASMQMVFDYHNTTVAQWDLATEYLSINYAKIIPNQPVTNSPYNVADCMCHQNSCETSCTTSNRPFKLCYAALPVYIDDNVPNPTVQWFDLLFSNRSYNSVQEVNPGLSANTMSWSDIVDQIDSCRPFILVITKSGEQTQITSHAVVGKGYFESFSVEDNQMLQFVVINDPWNVCEGCERMIPYSSFLRDLNDSQVNCVLAYTYNIFPKTDQTCSSCDSEEPFTNSLLVNTVKEIRDSLGNFIGTLKSTYTDEEYQAFINQDFIYSRIKKKFISLNNVLDTKNNNPPF
ncbi:MAG: hypothetical protein IPJ74_04945 [Saprospiraceae bacterium]|nr:hypothetical protein [Saprospiraceae bacterium]